MEYPMGTLSDHVTRLQTSVVRDLGFSESPRTRQPFECRFRTILRRAGSAEVFAAHCDLPLPFVPYPGLGIEIGDLPWSVREVSYNYSDAQFIIQLNEYPFGCHDEEVTDEIVQEAVLELRSEGWAVDRLIAYLAS
jgi:hypothetical protein